MRIVKSIILISDNELSIETIEEIKLDKFINSNKTETSLAIELESGRLYLDFSEDIILDYDEEELENIPIKNPKFLSIEFSSIEALKALLKKFGSLEAIKDASLEELSQTQGITPALARKVKGFLSNSPVL